MWGAGEWQGLGLQQRQQETLGHHSTGQFPGQVADNLQKSTQKVSVCHQGKKKKKSVTFLHRMTSLQIYTTDVLASRLSVLLLHHFLSLSNSVAGRWIVIMGTTADEDRDESWGGGGG